MTSPHDTGEILLRYLRLAREAVVWKLEGLSELDARRPLTPTGTNLLGLVQHLATVELGYVAETFGRPHGLDLPWDDPEGDPNGDLVVDPARSRADVLDLHEQAASLTEQAVRDLGVDARGEVPWWPEERRAVTLELVLVHLVAEVNRHAGQADVLREHLDGAVGHRPGVSNLPDDGYDWPAHHARVQAAAEAAAP